MGFGKNCISQKRRSSSEMLVGQLRFQLGWGFVPCHRITCATSLQELVTCLLCHSSFTLHIRSWVQSCNVGVTDTRRNRKKYKNSNFFGCLVLILCAQRMQENAFLAFEVYFSWARIVGQKRFGNKNEVVLCSSVGEVPWHEWHSMEPGGAICRRNAGLIVAGGLLGPF